MKMVKWVEMVEYPISNKEYPISKVKYASLQPLPSLTVFTNCETFFFLLVRLELPFRPAGSIAASFGLVPAGEHPSDVPLPALRLVVSAPAEQPFSQARISCWILGVEFTH
ncbi:MAG: hypothetical protein PF904_19215 [Kiritimatiellae bacterium]|nr:hypothetical protein [Kiritimatiellia bacterium]